MNNQTTISNSGLPLAVDLALDKGLPKYSPVAYLQKSMSLASVIVVCHLAQSKAGNASVTWDRNPEANITGYKVLWGTKLGTYPYGLDVGNNIDANLQNLPDGQLVFVVVRAYNSSNKESPLSEPLPIQTPYIVPNKPTGLAIQSQNLGEVTINWTAVPNLITRIYVGTQLGQGIQKYEVPASDHAITISGLSKRTPSQYYFSISLVDPKTGLESALTNLPVISSNGVVGSSPLLARSLSPVLVTSFSTPEVLNTSGSLTAKIQIEPVRQYPLLTISGPKGKKFTIQSSDGSTSWQNTFTSYLTSEAFVFIDTREKIARRFYRVASDK